MIIRFFCQNFANKNNERQSRSKYPSVEAIDARAANAEAEQIWFHQDPAQCSEILRFAENLRSVQMWRNFLKNCLAENMQSRTNNLKILLSKTYVFYDECSYRLRISVKQMTQWWMPRVEGVLLWLKHMVLHLQSWEVSKKLWISACMKSPKKLKEVLHKNFRRKGQSWLLPAEVVVNSEADSEKTFKCQKTSTDISTASVENSKRESLAASTTIAMSEFFFLSCTPRTRCLHSKFPRLMFLFAVCTAVNDKPF